MKNVKKILLLLALLGAVLLTACGRSDVVLTVNKDGSFHAEINYGIVKSLVANDEAMAQVKSLITDSLDQNEIPYTESEDDEYVTISVERDFKDLAELTSQEAWRGVSFVPSFTASETNSAIWTRYEDGRLKFSGTLNVDTFNAQSIVGDSGNVATFGGSLRIILPSEADEAVGGEDDGNGYVWSGNSGDNVEMSLVSEKIFEDLTPADADGGTKGKNSGGIWKKILQYFNRSNSDVDGLSNSDMDGYSGNSGGTRITSIIALVIAIVILIIIAVTVIVVLLKRKKKNQE